MSDQSIPGYADPDFVASEEPRHSPLVQPDLQCIAAARYGRRELLRGGLALAVGSLFGAVLPRVALARETVVESAVASAVASATGQVAGSLLGFASVPVSRADTAVVPAGYRLQVLLPWGEPISGSYPAFAPDNSAAEQALQMGMHHDGMHFFPLEGSREGLLVLNHEYAEPRLMHTAAAGLPLGAYDVPLQADGSRDPEQVRKEMNAHGLSVVRIRRGADGQWGAVRDARNRRITALTPMEFRGPLRGDPRLQTRYSPAGLATRGTLNNCSHGVTPWGTYLTCEENWHFYFVREGDGVPASQSRYSVGPHNAWRWHLAATNPGGEDDDDCARFDATPRGASAAEDYRNEPHAFGWVVEVDPFDPGSTPVKRTHLGRFSHEGVVFAPVVEGRPLVLYSGDDSAFEYIYKFVSARPYHRATADGSLLDQGTLYAARFAGDGSGEWLALVPGENGLTPEAGFATLADVLLNSRGAADVAGATPMDRPEWGAVDPGTGAVYFTLTNNKRRREEQVDAANPRPANHFGQIVRWQEAGGDHAAQSFTWELFLLAGDADNSRDLQGGALDDDNLLAMPDGLWFDADRRLWIQTDVSDLDQNKGRYRPMGNNAMLAADPDTGELRRFFTGPVGAEISGCVTTPDQTAMFINVQHPGATTSAADFARGKLDSHWPEGGAALPRSATLVITREDGGKIGG